MSYSILGPKYFDFKFWSKCLKILGRIWTGLATQQANVQTREEFLGETAQPGIKKIFKN